MIPRVKELADADDGWTRAMADRVLVQCPGTREFLDSRFPVETWPWALGQIVPGASREERDRNLNARLTNILSGSDEAARLETLGLVGGNHYRAPVNQIQVDAQVIEAIIPLTQSESEEERRRAAYALATIHHIDPVRSRTTLVKLARDPSGVVRQMIAFGLSDQLEVPEVQAAISALLEDPLPKVRYFTILALGPGKFVSNLRDLASCDDPETAKNAAGALERLRQQATQALTPVRMR